MENDSIFHDEKKFKNFISGECESHEGTDVIRVKQIKLEV